MPDVVIVAGPTAAGKSDVSIQLARMTQGQIISADSMQVYRYMDIGSAKLDRSAMGGIKHHLIDVLDPTEEFNVSVFTDLASEAIEEIKKEGSLPIICGGTGFYIQALIKGIDFSDREVDSTIREELESEAESKGTGYIEEMAARVDPEYAAANHGNTKRLIRALEYYRLTGQRMSEKNAREMKQGYRYEPLFFVLTMPRELLYERIDRRVDLMMEEGLLDEVRHLIDMGVKRDMTSMQGLGYRQIYDHLMGETDLHSAVDEIKKQTRHFAKRQLTWFRREKDAIWIDISEYKDSKAAAEKIKEYIDDKI
ncbi:MAG: tRNA (adenosine(37)-N6)-dimethylallyltransferase MiaA [Lachnospiraceae bacterium]|nr:tRNA (adenosine(37)-N6)-dimethylallyltransferase MiaA [Lachnospiraceae bacterium]